MLEVLAAMWQIKRHGFPTREALSELTENKKTFQICQEDTELEQKLCHMIFYLIYAQFIWIFVEITIRKLEDIEVIFGRFLAIHLVDNNLMITLIDRTDLMDHIVSEFFLHFALRGKLIGSAFHFSTSKTIRNNVIHLL